ncbi:thiopeptide-type bacteriocin biosynthesis protein [Chryseobacterium tructae]|uniref:Thiopeptide-type bacteriocin biosynthesis protein n=1 Tax=Chryseobacterium tructae TaxID=1037380 RepID=A0ABV7Y024_9FLAO|nr:thiopeptide-type bacteriocin biosynthesis protein [Chryseobacterium tructae]MDN3692981.1 thiopeptide-type bacteriocin biosynthesis protein [Chryseobacterium tructae]
MKTRKYAPGSEWLYFKIYTGYKTADELLLNKIYPLILDLKRKQYINQFFFIRYSDPHFHIRVRVHITKAEYLGIIMGLFNQKLSRLLKNNVIWKIQIDTYSREIERYNLHLIDHAESFFHIDSDYIIKILKTINNQLAHNEDVKWIIGLRLIDDTLNLFCKETHEKLKIMTMMSDSFKKEFGFDMYNSKQFNEKYRENKTKIDAVLSGVDLIDSQSYDSLYLICKKRNKELVPIVSLIQKIQSEKRLNFHIVTDLIHMTLNRLIPAENRLHELILYDFVKRYYIGITARKKNDKSTARATVEELSRQEIAS